MSQAVYEGHRTYRIRGVGVAAVVAVGLTALTLVIATVLYWAIKISIDRGGYAGSLDAASAMEDVGVVVAIAFDAGQLASLVLTIIWLWRARKNLDAFPDTKPSLALGWTIGGWFVPVANLFVPGRMMANAARESTRNRWVTRAAVVWWIGLVIAMIVNRFGNVAAEGMLDSVYVYDMTVLSDYYRELARTNTVAATAGAIAAAAFAFVVSRISTAQEERIYRGWYEEQNRALTTPGPAAADRAPTGFAGAQDHPGGTERWDPAASAGTGGGAGPVGVGADPTSPPGIGGGSDSVGVPADPAGGGQPLPGAGAGPMADPVMGVTRSPSAPEQGGSATIGA